MTTAAPTTVPPTTLVPTTLAPTTVAPTTSIPTTTLTTAPPTTAGPTTVPPTTPPPIVIDGGPITIYVSVRSYFSYFPAAPINSSLNIEYAVDPIEITLGILGEQLHQWINAGPIDIVVSVEGEYVESVTIDAGSINIEVSIESYGTLVEGVKCNWVKWSKIGYLDFTIDKSNVAGERPLDWKGCIYKLLKLDKVIIAYGENGVTVLNPSDVHYGIDTIYRVGMKGVNAIAGTDAIHFFIDNTGKLFNVSKEGLELLDYSEYLSQMTNPVLAIDINKMLLYICDGTYGYIYSIRSKSLGAGPVNVTGLGVQGTTLYVVSPAAIATPKFEICTDIYDMGTRKPKTIHLIEVSTELTEHLQLLVEYRVSNRKEFKDSMWHYVNPDGIAYAPCYGIDFRFRIRSYIYEQFEIDRLKINGSIHNFSHRDYLAARQRTL